MNKYTDERKMEALKFFEEGCTAREIFEVLNIPMGTLYRWKSELRDPKSQQIVAGGDELLQLRQRVEKLEAYIAKIERAKAKEQDYEDSPTTLLFKRK